MGSYLGKPDPPSAPARAHTDFTGPVTRRPTQPLHQVHRVQHIHRAHPAPRHRPARRPPNWDPSKPAARRFNEAWRRFPMRRPPPSILGPQPSDWWDSYLKRSIWSLRHPRAVWSPVTVKIAPPERSAPPPAPPAEVITLAGSSAMEKTPGPDPCAKEMVLTALRESRKGRVRLVEPLFAENLDPQRPETRPSAFQALRRNGDPPPYLPQPGPLQRGRRPRTSDPTLRQRPSCSSISSLASRPSRGPLQAQRNAISSSYSSWRKCSEPLKSSSPQAPEWPVKRPEKGRRGHSPVSLDADDSLEDSSSSEPPHPEIPLLLCDPGNPAPQTTGPPLGDAGYSDGEERAKSRQSGQAQEATTQATADSGSEKPGVLSPAMLSVGTVPALASALTVESLKKGQQFPEPLVCPQPTADVICATQSLPEPPRPLASQSAPPPGPPSDSQPEAALILLTTVSTTSPAMDTSHLPSIPEAARPQHSLGDAPAPPTNDLLGKPSSPTPPPPTPLPSAATSTDPTTTPSPGLPPTSDLGAVTSSRVCMTQSVSTYTFKPIFGVVAPLHVGTPPSLQQSSPLASPTAPLPGLFQGLVKDSSGAVGPSPAGASKTGTSQTPLDLGRVTVTSVMSSTVATSPTSSSQASLPGATQAIGASSTAPTGFVVPLPPPPAQQTMQTGAVLSQVPPSTISSTSTTNVGHLGSPVSASAVTTPKQPAWSPSSSSAIPTLVAAPRQSGPKRPYRQPAGTPSRPAVGSAPKKPRAATAALSPSSSAGTRPKPALSRSTNLGAGPQGGSSAAAGFPFHQAGSAGSGVVSLVPPSGAGGAVFGSTAPRPFAFGGVETPMDCGESGTGGTGPGTSTAAGAGAFSVRPVPPRGTTGPVPPFGGGWSQSATGRGSGSSAFAAGGAGLSAGKVAFAGLAVAPLAQGASGPAKNGSGFGAGGPSPAQGALGRSPFRASAPSFSIGAKSKTPKSREQGHSRRHHGHRK